MFSVLIPYYQKELAIRLVLSALVENEASIREILVYCDGCPKPDFSHPLIEYLHSPLNQGLVHGRNTLLRRAKSQAVLFLDADAVICAEFFKILEQNWDRKSFFGGQEADSPKEGRHNRFRHLFFRQTLGSVNLYPAPFCMGICFGGLKKEFLSLGGFNSAFRNHGEDLEFSFYAQKKDRFIQYIADLKIYHFRQDDAKSLRHMVRQHGLWQMRAHRLYDKNPQELIQKNLLWMIICLKACLYEERDPLLALLSLWYNLISLNSKILAYSLFLKGTYARRERHIELSDSP